jgi:hypothetical protein
MTENGAPSGALFLSSGQNLFGGLASQTSSTTAIVFTTVLVIRQKGSLDLNSPVNIA